MAVVISIINNKGGVGKTTSTEILAELMAYTGQRVLVVDLDQQSNLSMLFGTYIDDSETVIAGIDMPAKENVAEIFKYRYREVQDVCKTIYQTQVPGVDIIPSSSRHRNTQLAININKTGNNNVILKKALQAVDSNYDYILIDNAPANDILTVNSMFASDYVLVPVRVEGFSYKGLRETLDSILYIKDEHDLDKLKFMGTFITQAEKNTKVFKYNQALYAQELQQRFFTSAVRKDRTINEIETFYQPLLKYNPNSNALTDYAALLLEMDILPSSSAGLLIQSITPED